MPELAFRYEAIMYSPGCDEYGEPLRVPGTVKLRCDEYPILKRTAKGFWLDDSCGNPWKFVLSSAKKRFACETRAEALESFIARKRRQVKICNAQVSYAEQAIKLAQASCNNPANPIPDDISRNYLI